MAIEVDKLLGEIRARGPRALQPLYWEYRDQFLNYMTRFSHDEDLRLDAFQEAMIAFYEYVRDGKYDPTKSSPKTMLFMMGRAYLINRIKKEIRNTSKEADELERMIESHVIEHNEFTLDDQQKEIKKALQQIGERCRELLLRFYYQNCSILEICDQMGYKNANVVSAHKSRCIKQLKNVLLGT